MANEILWRYKGSATLYAILRKKSNGYAWNGTTEVAWSNGDIGTYDIPLTSLGGDVYAADFPSGASSSTNYQAIIYRQDGASPSVNDYILGYLDITGTTASAAAGTGTELTAAQIQAKIDDVNTQLATLVSSITSVVDIQTLDVRISNSQKVRFLQDERKFWEDKLKGIPAADWYYPVADGDWEP